MKELNEYLRLILDREQVLDDRLIREIYARDASYFEIRPEAVVRPRTVEEVRSVLDAAHKFKVGVTFRTGGTSLSGQTLGKGIICELRTDWKNFEVRNGGGSIWFEPGLTVDQVNERLKGYHSHIGPDPASSVAAMMGGVLANNSSGMEAGVRHNSYHTLRSMEFMLANGHRYNSALEEDRRRFAEQERDLCRGLLEIRREIMNNEEMRSKIERKYQIKNVNGYSMNAFVDFDDPMDIFIHALIGSEGTLAFIISAELNTLPLYDHYSSSLLYFDNVTTAAASAKWLGDSGALAVELMDYASLMSYQGKTSTLAPGTTAMLIDYGANSSEELADITGRIKQGISGLKGLIEASPFTTTVGERQKLWNLRNGIFPCVAGARVPGTTVIREDVAAPVGDLDRLVDGIQRLFAKHGYQGAIFGHARDGNMHPLITSGMDSKADSTNFRNFIEGFVDHVLSLNGSLKGEHGTGRAMAPFVEREWGEDIYALMRRLKQIADPKGTLNPDVVISSDPEAFMKDIKHMHLFGEDIHYDVADKCMECGYCENVCPSRNITLTPRQRIQAHRIFKAYPDDKELQKQYGYVGRRTCCTDGTCMLPCPMHINTAIITDADREQKIKSTALAKGLTYSANHFGGTDKAIRGLLRAGIITGKIVTPYPLVWATQFLQKLHIRAPEYSRFFAAPPKAITSYPSNPDYLYFPACVTRIFGGSSLGKDDLITVMLRLADRAGYSMALPADMHSLCCSQIWEHKGDPDGQRVMANRLVEKFYEMSDEGRVPIVCDTTSCTHTMLRSVADVLTEENKARYARLKIIDILEWLDRDVMPKLKVTKRKRCVVIHPTCASKLLGINMVMGKIAKQCADEVIIPIDARCCGTAGDRGFIYPEVAQRATEPEKRSVDALVAEGKPIDGYYSLARTCEISMSKTIGRPYESVAYLVDETTESIRN